MHHNRLSPVTAREMDIWESTRTTFDDSDSDSEVNISLSSGEETDDENIPAPVVERRYPDRSRKQRAIPNAIPGDILNI